MPGRLVPLPPASSAVGASSLGTVHSGAALDRPEEPLPLGTRTDCVRRQTGIEALTFSERSSCFLPVSLLSKRARAHLQGLKFLSA